MDDSDQAKKKEKRYWTLGPVSLLAVLLVAAVSIGTKIVIATPTIGMTDLLSLILALFSIGISSQFYFNADKASNKFYNRSYRFTKEISELLGRFEERLRHIDQIMQKMEARIYQIPIDPVVVREKIDEEAEAVISAKDALASIREKLEKDTLSEEDKKKYLDQLEQKQRELLAAEAAIETLEGKLRQAHEQANWASATEFDEPMAILARFADERPKVTGAPLSIFSRVWLEFAKTLPASDIALLKSHGLIEEDMTFTTAGRILARRIASQRLRERRGIGSRPPS